MIYFLVSIFGLVIGSFLNVCIHRLPRSLSVVSPGSSCPSCGAMIRPIHNIPILSYLFLRGKCASCGQRISLRYPAVEMLSAAAGVALLLAGFAGREFFIYWFFSLLLITISFIDIEHGIVPDILTIPTTIAGLLLFFSVDRFIGAFAGSLSIIFMGIAGKFLFKKDAVGGGDVKLMAMIGAFLGWQKVLLTFFISPFFGSAAGIVVILKKKGETIPYAPYLALGAFVSLIFGDKILNALFGR